MKRIQMITLVGLFAMAGSAYGFEWSESGVELDAPKDGATVCQWSS